MKARASEKCAAAWLEPHGNDAAFRREVLPGRAYKSWRNKETAVQPGWGTPDSFTQAVSGGSGRLRVDYAFQQRYERDLIDRIPKIGKIQTEGCAPMVSSLKAGKEKAEPVIPATRIPILSTGNPGKLYTDLYTLLGRTGGTMEAASDTETFQVMLHFARSEGTAVEPVAAMAFARAAERFSREIICEDELVVCFCTGPTFPVEKPVLGKPRRVDVTLSAPQLPASENLNEKTKDDALFIRHFLDARKSYRVFQPLGIGEGLTQARSRQPDLIIQGLVMPEIIGFWYRKRLSTILEPGTSPLIANSDKDITAEELQYFNGFIEGMYQKGSSPVRAFANQVVEVIEQKGSVEDRGNECSYLIH